MENDIKVFEEKSLVIAEGLKKLKDEKQRLEKEEKDLKNTLEKLFNQYDLKSFKNDYFSITRVEASESVSLNEKEFKEKEPELYEELLEDYKKVSKRKGYIRISVK